LGHFHARSLIKRKQASKIEKKRFNRKSKKDRLGC